MTAVTWIALAVAVPMLLLVLAWDRWKASGEASRPGELASAELVYMEKLFRIQDPIRLVARVDRVYRLPGGSLVLVELKTRWRDRAYLSDVIQLSAQRLAIEQQTGAVVEPYAFVTVLSVGRHRRLRSYRVLLLDAEEVVRLHDRREAILAMRAAPAYPVSEAACRGCALRSKCDRFRRPRDC